ncbi:MAG: fructosamine kinase family protein [Chitinophagales bacterium]|nr:fructosamine kinase family protein [Chitinophagales bacterium]MDW8428140.1 fructosamine kinase family protein [Chitinophagales bacterium]
MELKQVAERMLQAAGIDQPVSSLTPAGGGCINACYHVYTPSTKFFLKVNDARAYPDMFRCEARGLELINAAVPDFAPIPVAVHVDEKQQYLLLTFCGGGRPSRTFWQRFAQRMVQLHRTTRQQFGLDHDNYIGSLPQSNRSHDRWTDFYFHERLLPQVRRAVAQEALPKQALNLVEKIYDRLSDFFPDEPPSLVHGDLWSGNYLVGADGLPVVIDPAIYFGFREMDWAMMDLFGGFDQRMRHSYEELFPLKPGYMQRRPLCQLYPLLVHANLFGGHYSASAYRLLKQYGS